MSVALLPFIDAEAVQVTLNEIYQRKPVEAAPEVQFLTSALNTTRVLESNVINENGHIKQVKVLYTPRITETEVDTTITTDCENGDSIGDLSTTYDIDETSGAQFIISVPIADLNRRMESDPEYLARVTMEAIDGVRRKMQTGVATQMALLGGKFATDGGEKTSSLSNANTLKSVATKFPAAVDGGKPNPEALQEIAFSALNSGFTGTPYVFGMGEIFRYFQMLGSMGTFSDSGLDFVKFYNAQGVSMLPSLRLHNALNGAGTDNKFLVVDAGAIHLLQYNKFTDPSAKVRQDNLIMDTIVDPLTGIELNYKFYLNPCGEKYNILISTAYKVVGLPDDMYAGGDRLDGCNGVIEFKIANT